MVAADEFNNIIHYTKGLRMKYIFIYIFLVVTFMCLERTNLVAQDEAKISQLQIVDAKLGKVVKDRMIMEEDSTFAKNSKVFLWMKITGGASDEITVTWKNGTITHATTLMIGGSPWRTWASKTVWKTGEWVVTVTDASGKVLKEMTFNVE